MLTIHEGSILEVPADVIVNPANGHLRHSGGLARVIEQAATDDGSYMSAQTARLVRDLKREAAVMQWRLDHANAPLVAAGNAHVTSAGCLPFKAVIHAVGPVWNGGGFCEDTLLASAHREALKLASLAGAESIAFPAISCGIFGFPVDRAARIAVYECSQWDDLAITFALVEDAHVEAYREAIHGC